MRRQRRVSTRRSVEDEEADLVLWNVDRAFEADACPLLRQLLGGRACPPLARRRALPPGPGRGRSRRGSWACARRYDRPDAAETSERLNFARPGRSVSAAGARARCASARRAWRRCGSGGWPPSARRGTARRRPRGSSGPRRPGRRRGARPPSALPRACGRRCSRARRAPLDPGGRPSCSKPASAARIASRAGALLPRAPADDAECEQRARPPEGIADRLVLRDRLLQEGSGLIDVSPGGGDETAASGHLREHPLAAEPYRIRLPDVDDSHRVVDPTELEQQPRRSRRSTSGCSARPTRARRPADRPGRATPRLSTRLRPRARRVPGPRCAGAGGARTALRPARGLVPNARARARAGRDGRR